MSKKLLILIIILIITIILFFSCTSSYAQNEVRVSEKLWITCPKNLALFHIFVILSPSGERMRDRFLHPLVDRARDHFQPFKDHPAVTSTDKIFQMMWYFVFNYAALYYSEFPEAQLGGVIPTEYKEWKSMEKILWKKEGNGEMFSMYS